MGKVIIQNYTCKNPITMIGFEAGICWGADTGDEKKNYRRGLDCLESGHGRTFEFPDVYLTLEGYLTFSCIPYQILRLQFCSSLLRRLFCAGQQFVQRDSFRVFSLGQNVI